MPPKVCGYVRENATELDDGKEDDDEDIKVNTLKILLKYSHFILLKYSFSAMIGHYESRRGAQIA